MGQNPSILIEDGKDAIPEQVVDSTPPSTTDKEEDDDTVYANWLAKWVTETEEKYPRIYNIIVNMLIPMLLLILMTMLFGHGLATVEKAGELEANIDSIEAQFDRMAEIRKVQTTTRESYKNCIDDFVQESQSEIINSTELGNFLKTCSSVNNVTEQLLYDLNESTKVETTDNYMSFEWNTCSEDGMKRKGQDSGVQGKFLLDRWYESYYSNTNNILSGDEEVTAKFEARNEISKYCKVNSAGGSVFWFTVMTTMGYGNTAPTSKEGRAMVFVLGFLSVLAFGTVIGATSYVIINIVDYMFLKSPWTRCLTKGWRAIVFWFSVFIVWVVVIARLLALYNARRYDDEGNFYDLFWFSYISLMTIGFGDFHILHEVFYQLDLLYIPFFMLFGYSFLGIFGMKLTNAMFELFEKHGLIDDEDLSDHLRGTLPAEVKLSFTVD